MSTLNGSCKNTWSRYRCSDKSFPPHSLVSVAVLQRSPAGRNRLPVILVRDDSNTDFVRDIDPGDRGIGRRGLRTHGSAFAADSTHFPEGHFQLKQLWQSISTGKTSVVYVPAPRAGKGQILVRVAASAISAGTERSVVEFAEKNLIQKAMARPDLVKQVIAKGRREGWISAIEAARNRLDSELVLGYSNAGVVVDVGEDMSGFRVGDRVACAGGGFATHSEIVRIPRNLAAVIPEGPGQRDVPFEEAAFATVAAIALQGIRLAEPQLGEIVAVIGLGLIGQIVVQLAQANGCTVIGMDPSNERCSLAERMGCTATARSNEEMEALAARASNGRGVDSVLIAAATESSGPVSLAAEIARDRAKVVSVGVVGLSLPRKPYFMKELDFRVSRSSGPGRWDVEYEEKGRDYPIGYVRWTEGRNLAAVLQLLAAGRLDFGPLITHRFSIDEADKGYELISGKSREPYLGVVITYPHEPSFARRIELPASSTSVARAEGVRVGMIGAGNFATATLLPAMKATREIEFAGICAAGGSSARSAGLRHGFRFCASDESELLRDDSINVIAVCTRHSAHARQVVAAIRAGKHVFCEKPLALNEEQLASVLRAYEQQLPARLLLVGYNRRFAPLAQRLKASVGGLAEPLVMHYRVNAGFIPLDHWTQDLEQGGGRILGEVCHFVDFLSFLCGHPVTSVSASVLPNTGRYADDNLAATLRFADGSIGTIVYTANGDKSFSKERVEVFAQGRVAVLDDFRRLEVVRDGKRTTAKSRLRVDKGHRGEWSAFVDAIRKGGPSPISLAEIVNSTLATFALAHAGSEGLAVQVDTEGFISRVREGEWHAAEGEA
jgi:predicted dehydrogenase